MNCSRSEVLIGILVIALTTLIFAGNSMATQQADKHLTDMENIVKKIEKTKIVERDAEVFGSLIDQYVKSMDNDSKSVKDDKKKLDAFRTTAKGFEKRLRNLQTSLQRVEGKIKSGEIKLSREVLPKLNSPAHQEFKNSLHPDALKQYQRMYPDIFKAEATPPTTLARLSIASDIDPAQSFTNFLGGIFGTDAYAAPLCFQCPADMANCIAKQCKCAWYRFWCCAPSVGCVTSYSLCLAVCTWY